MRRCSGHGQLIVVRLLLRLQRRSTTASFSRAEQSRAGRGTAAGIGTVIMSKSLHSPTARLLQSSRLFSLPRPLPAASLETQATGGIRSSDTATLPYPTHQAIATPASSHFRGDWGLKRPIPTRTTARSGTPVIRVKAQDNLAHITDFESAADHVLTEAKWRQMGIPLISKTQRDKFTSGKTPRSVYDEDIDITDLKAAQAAAPATASTQDSTSQQRWKYEGPYIAGMDESEFEEYVTRRLAKRKVEFRAFLLKRMVATRIENERHQNRDRGLGGALSAARMNELRAEVEQNYDAEEKRLRDEHIHQHLGSELAAAICEFLDLPGVIATTKSAYDAQTERMTQALANQHGPPGPPTTHPGAGLAYIRSNAFLENHPFWGPQEQRSPVKARVLRPRSSSLYRANPVQLGVGGVVTTFHSEAPPATRFDRTASMEYTEEQREERYLEVSSMINSLDENLPGGNKTWVQTQTATINEDGKVQLEITYGTSEAIAVKRNKVEEIHHARSNTVPPYTGTYGRPPANYGTQVSWSSARPNRQNTGSQTSGFDAQLGRSSTQGELPGNVASAKIQELMAQQRASPYETQ